MAPLSWATVPWAFTHYYNGNYTPLDFLSHNLDVQAFQLNAGRHHDVNVLLGSLERRIALLGADGDGLDGEA